MSQLSQSGEGKALLKEGGEITVIVPTWNRKELLSRCLDSLRRQTAPCRVLVVDDGSTDGTEELVRHQFSAFDYLRLGQNLGFCRAVNEGIRRAYTPFLALLNNDTEADPGWMEAGLSAFERFPSYWFFASRIVNFFARDLLDSAGDCYSRSGMPYKRGGGRRLGEFSRSGPVLGASAGAAFYRRDLFDRIGLFDESYHMYLEDVDLSLRAQLAGYPCLYLPDAVVYHIEAASDPGRRTQALEGANRPPSSGCRASTIRPFYSDRRVYWITRNRWQLMVTHQPVRHLPWLLYGWTRSFLFHLLKAGCAGAFLRGLAAGIRSSPRALAKRRQLRSQRVLSVRDLCRMMSAC